MACANIPARPAFAQRTCSYGYYLPSSDLCSGPRTENETYEYHFSMNDIQRRGIGMTSQRTRERLIRRLQEEGITSQAVLNAMRNTPRHLFVDEALAHRAYEDSALPIGYSQTISQPFVVARMTEVLLSAGIPEKVLEIGTGCGYQTAVLARLVPKVYSVERIKPLLDMARQRLRQQGHRNVQLKLSDGTLGWPEKGPFNGIISTAAPEEVPDELLRQLAPNGILVIPVGPSNRQVLQAIVRRGNAAEYDTVNLEAVRFVPLLGGVEH